MTVIDVGANFGWFSLIFSTLLGNQGSVHSFEPVPPTFKILKQNVRINKTNSEIILNKMALGSSRGKINLHLFKNF